VTLADTLQEAGQSLEDAFFLAQDRELIAQHKKLKKLKETKENLAKASGIANDAVLQKLVDLDIHPDVVASLGIVPLVEVAWADHEVHEKEKEAVLKAATQRGVCKKGDANHIMLDRWLTHRPGPELMDAWVHYVQGLKGVLGKAEWKALGDELLDHARQVAEASGGFLGLTSGMSGDEKKMLEKIATAFR
jgi:regulator of sigma D